MAKTNNTAVHQTTTASPAPATVAPAVASKQGSVSAAPPSPTELQQDASDFIDLFTSLVEDSPEPEANANGKATPEAPSSRKAKASPASEPEVSETPTALPDSEEEEDVPLLGDDETEDQDADDDDAETDEDEDTEGTDKAQKALSQKLYKAREAKRQLKTQLEAVQAKAKELEDQVAKITSGTTAPKFDGFFADAKTLDDLAAKENWLEARAAHLEDNDFGFSEVDAATGEETERDPQWIKQQLRAVRAELKRLPHLRTALETTVQRSEQSAARARKVYPFVFDTSSKHHAMVLDLIKEHPELQTSPDRALLLGRLAVAKLVESKQYALVPKTKQAAAPAPAAAQAKPAPVARAAPSVSPVSPSRSQPAALPPVLSSRSQQAEEWMAGVVGA